MKRLAIAALVGLAILVSGASAMAVKRTPSDLVRQMVDRARVQPAFNGTVQSVDDYGARLATIIVADVTALQVRIADHIDIGTNDAPKLHPGDKLEVRWWDEEYTAVALKRHTTFLPFVAGGSTRVTPVATPQWTAGYPRIVGTDIQGAWGSVPGAIRYDVWRNSSPSPDGAEFVISTDRNFFTVPAGLGELSELLTNGGFESGGFTGWQADSAYTYFNIETTTVKTGTYSLKAYVAVGTLAAASFATERFDIVAGKTYAFSFWHKVTALGTPPEVVVNWRNAAGTYLSSDVIKSFTGTDAAFTQATISATAPVNAAYGEVSIYGYTLPFMVWGNGATIYFDDFSVTGENATGTYLYAVRAVDANGNASPFSAWLQPIAQTALLGTAQFVPGVGIKASAVTDQVSNKVFAGDGSLVTLTVGSASAWGETPSGAINGVNTTFTLANSPVGGTLRLHQNGLRLREGASNDYTLSGNTITMNVAPTTGDWLLADYVY